MKNSILYLIGCVILGLTLFVSMVSANDSIPRFTYSENLYPKFITALQKFIDCNDYDFKGSNGTNILRGSENYDRNRYNGRIIDVTAENTKFPSVFVSNINQEYKIDIPTDGVTIQGIKSLGNIHYYGSKVGDHQKISYYFPFEKDGWNLFVNNKAYGPFGDVHFIGINGDGGVYFLVDNKHLYYNGSLLVKNFNPSNQNGVTYPTLIKNTSYIFSGPEVMSFCNSNGCKISQDSSMRNLYFHNRKLEVGSFNIVGKFSILKDYLLLIQQDVNICNYSLITPLGRKISLLNVECSKIEPICKEPNMK